MQNISLTRIIRI